VFSSFQKKIKTSNSSYTKIFNVPDGTYHFFGEQKYYFEKKICVYKNNDRISRKVKPNIKKQIIDGLQLDRNASFSGWEKDEIPPGIFICKFIFINTPLICIFFHLDFFFIIHYNIFLALPHS
jgi:hypothetical protein